jgi:hypothetical protein
MVNLVIRMVLRIFDRFGPRMHVAHLSAQAAVVQNVYWLLLDLWQAPVR